jgi:hypothetical protein
VLERFTIFMESISVLTRHRSFVLLAALATTNASAADAVFFGDFESIIPVQSLRENSEFASGTPVDLEPAIVTATALTSSNTKLTLFLQGSGSYQWSAIEAYGDALGQPPAVGDCVRVKGTFVEFNGAAEISSMIWSADSAPADCSGIVNPPSFVMLDSVATDTNPGMTGNQPGPLAESYESALVTIQNVTVLTTSTRTFEVYDGANSGTYLLVDDFFYHYDAIVGAKFSSITGVFMEFDSQTDTVYELAPRSALDIVVEP